MGNTRDEAERVVRRDYAIPRKAGLRVITALFETFGGFGEGLVELLRAASRQRANKLNTAEYQLTSWSAQTWMSYQTQLISVKLHRATAFHIAREMGAGALAAAAAPAGDVI